MTRGRLGLVALVVGVAVGSGARRRTADARVVPPGPLEVRGQLAALEDRLTAELHRAERERRRAGAVTLALVLLALVTGTLLVVLGDPPAALVAVVLGADLVVVVGALAVAVRTDRTPRRPGG